MKCSTVKPVAIQECYLLHGGHVTSHIPPPSYILRRSSATINGHSCVFSGSKLMSWCHDGSFKMSIFVAILHQYTLVILVNQHSPSTCCSHVSAVHDNGVKASLKFKKNHPAANQSWRKISNHRWIPDSKILVCNRKIMIYNIKTSEKTYQCTLTNIMNCHVMSHLYVLYIFHHHSWAHGRLPTGYQPLFKLIRQTLPLAISQSHKHQPWLKNIKKT